MIIEHETNVTAKTIASPEVKAAAMKVLIGAAQGWDDHVMRIIELDEGGYSPKHAHHWPHFNYVVEGRGVLQVDGNDTSVEVGSFAVVPANTEHQYRNAGPGKFIV